MLGPLAPHVEPHSYDLCESHAARLTAPRGWELIRIETEVDPVRVTEDLEALANVVREEQVARQQPPREEPRAERDQPDPDHGRELADAIGDGVQRGHLRSVPGVLPGLDY